MFMSLTRAMKQFYVDLKIKNKLLFTYITIAFLPIVTISAIGYYAFTYYFHKNTSDYNIQIVNQLNNNIENNLVYMDNLSIFISYNEDIQFYLNNSSSMQIREKYDLEYKIQEFLINLTGFNPLVSSIHIYSTETKDILRINKLGEFKPDQFPDREDWYNNLMSSTKYKNVFVLKENGTVDKYCVGRKIIDKKTQAVIGVVLVSCDIKTIEELTKSFDFGPDGTIIILDREKNIVFASNSNKMNEKFQEILKFVPSRDGNYTSVINNEKVLVSSNTSEYSGWMINCFIPIKYIDRDISAILLIILLVSSVCLVIMIIISILIAKGISGPIVRLGKKMEQVKKGKFDTRILVDRKDEIGELSLTFNEMIERINDLITTVYETKIKEKEAELNALQAQINPHFLYNTLESIRTLAVLNDDYDTSKMITALGKFLRLKINSDQRTITVEREVEHAESYISLMHMKFKGKISFKVHVDRGIYKYRMVKLTFQPVIENAICHGLKNGEYPGEISLTGRMENDLLVFEIKDNGCGMEEGELSLLIQRINTGLKEENTSGSIGLKNVNARLKLIFGEEYGLKIDSAIGIGTTVTVKIPVVV